MRLRVMRSYTRERDGASPCYAVLYHGYASVSSERR